MTWRVYHDNLATSDLSDTNFSTKFKMLKNVILTGIRMQILFQDDPSFTNVTLKLYASKADLSLGALIANSTTTLAKAAIFTQNSSVSDLFFAFSNINLRVDETYFVVLNGAGYTGTDSSYIALVRSWPDPFYKTNVDSGFAKLGIAPFTVLFIGSDL